MGACPIFSKMVYLGMKKYSLVLLLLLCGFAFGHAQDKRASYYDNGNKKWEGHILDGKKMGEWTYYYDNGNLQREGIYRDGKPYGEWKEYWRGKQVKTGGKIIIHNGESVRHGLWIYYNKNGTEKAKGTFQAGKKVGIWYEYNTLGIQIGKKKY